MDKELIELFRTLALKHRNVISKYLNEHGIYLGQHRTIFTLSKHPDSTLTELAKRLEVSKESLSVSVRRLESSGLIEKTIDPNDRRSYLLRLSDEGDRVAKACRDGFDVINNSMFKNMTDEEKDSLVYLFNKMIRGLEEGVDYEKSI